LPIETNFDLGRKQNQMDNAFNQEGSCNEKIEGEKER